LSENNTLKNKRALIADDDLTNLMVLSKFLEKLGFEVIQSADGKKAIEDFVKYSPDIVFMDIMMPELNGYEATTQIKYLCQSNFIPVIFLTALNRPEELAKAVTAGGDDFLTKPIDMTILKSKIHSMERIRDLYRKVQNLNRTLQNADELANKVFDLAVFDKNIEIESIKTWFHNANKFNNDLFLLCHTPSNGINILFGHFNVQGLASAVGALPASEVFRSMSKKGFAPHSIIQKINAKLYDLLPNGITLSMIFINIDENLKHAKICNFNMADVYFISDREEKIIHKYSGKKDAIGQTPRYSRNVELDRVDINEHTRILLTNSNIYDIKNNDGVDYKEKFESAIEKGIANHEILDTVKSDILDHIAETEFSNNISFIEIPCSMQLISNKNTLEKEIESRKISHHPNETTLTSNKIKFNLQVNGSYIKAIDPVPTLLNNLESVTNIDKQHEALFTILTELYLNALDHGLLKLSSQLKKSDDGFGKYYQERDAALSKLDGGFIRFDLSLDFDESKYYLTIVVEDSGNGFDTTSVNSNKPNNEEPIGRGITLLKGLCENVSYNDIGNQVEVTFCWDII